MLNQNRVFERAMNSLQILAKASLCVQCSSLLNVSCAIHISTSQFRSFSGSKVHTRPRWQRDIKLWPFLVQLLHMFDDVGSFLTCLLWEACGVERGLGLAWVDTEQRDTCEQTSALGMYLVIHDEEYLEGLLDGDSPFSVPGCSMFCISSSSTWRTPAKRVMPVLPAP